MRRLLLLSLILCTAPIYGQGLSVVDSLILQGKEQIQKAVDAWDFHQMLAARAFFERLLNDPTYPWLIHYYIGYTDLRILNYCFSKKDKGKAKKFVEDGIEHLKKSIELKEDFAESYALLSSLYGNKIGLNPLLGITLGPKSARMQKKALKHIQKAIQCFNTFEAEKPILPTWGYDEAYAYLGLIQMDRGDPHAARESFQKALEINPNYGWVRYVLLERNPRPRLGLYIPLLTPSRC